ncbi:MAG TPA: hypothetical protein PKA77_00270 [Chitinophagaceae bacterium]|jgi:hypothetical protein|nr:hypothetical protein [Chitinophagaceae bacterium]HMU57106.1 hypothetical protein [Chitinophagaceae bacterium]
MKKILPPLIVTLLLLSCYTRRIDYIGASYPPTDIVDVFVDESAISRKFIIIGRIYVSDDFWNNEKEAVLKSVIKKGKLTGANAVLFREGYSIPVPVTDSLIPKSNRLQMISGRALISYNRSEILFLRYVQ